LCADPEFSDLCNDVFENVVSCVESQCATEATTEEPIPTGIETTEEPIQTGTELESTEGTDVETTGGATTVETTSGTTSPITECDFRTYCACIGGTFTLSTEKDNICEGYDEFVKTCQGVFDSGDAILAFDPASCEDSSVSSMEVTVAWSFESADQYEKYKDHFEEHLNQDYLFSMIEEFNNDEQNGVKVDFSWKENGFADYAEDDDNVDGADENDDNEDRCDWSGDYINLDEFFTEGGEGSAAGVNVVTALVVSVAALFVFGF